METIEKEEQGNVVSGKMKIFNSESEVDGFRLVIDGFRIDDFILKLTASLSN